MQIDELIPPDQLAAAGNAPERVGPLLKRALDTINTRLRQAFESNPDSAVQLVHQRADWIDQLLHRAWQAFLGPQQTAIALLAVGGYGRRELLPGSDLDLLLLLDDSDRERFKDGIEKFLTLLWDLGMDVGHSVRTVEECVQEGATDITVATNLMEARLLAGPRTLFDRLASSVGPDRIWPTPQFFEAKLAEQTARHRRFHDTAYNLEPNVKESPGGLRDIQMIGWVAKRHFNANTLRDLVEHRFLTDTEYQTLMDSQAFLWKVRTALHLLAGRREDRLLFDYQKPLAESFGYKSTRQHLAVEQFMRGYYVAVMELNRLNEMLLQLFQEAILLVNYSPEPKALNKRFQARKGFIEALNDKVFERYPFALLEVFLLLEQHPELYGVRASTIRLIRDHRHVINDAFRNDWRNRSLFMEILRQPQGITRALRRMNRYGILAEYLPAFGKVVGLMQYDLFHVYTVDEHTLTVVRNLRRFTVPEFEHEYPLCSRIVKTIPKLEILYLAGLFHDIAKGRGGDHSNIGSQEAYEFCIHHGMSKYDADMVAWLVKNHLVMSTTAQRQDISDPKIIMAFANLMQHQTRLDYLYLLTVADIRGTNPELWNSWKDALLIELYVATREALSRGLENPIDRSDTILDTQENARAYLEDYAVDSAAIRRVWDRLDDDYFLRHTPDEIAWHTQAIANSGPEDLPLVLIRDETERGATEIFVYTPDQDFLFAAATQSLDQMGLDVLDARIITTTGGFVLDTFIVLDSMGRPVDDPFQLQDIAAKLKSAVAHPSKQAVLTQRRIPRQLRHFTIPTEITFSTDLRNQRTVMEITTGDRPGLLSRIGRALVECDVRLQNAKISTFGERVEDAFFVTDAYNQPLTSHDQFECLRRNVRKYLND